MTTQPEWAEEFDEKFGNYNLTSEARYQGKLYKAKDFVKDFIRDTLKAHSQSLVEEIEKRELGFLGVIPAERYIEIVKNGSYDQMFDFAVKCTKDSIIALIKSNI